MDFRRVFLVGSYDHYHRRVTIKTIDRHTCYVILFRYDLDPKTFLGKLIGGFCALSGTFILTLPIPIVVNSFAGYYKNRLWRNEVAQKKRERANAQAREARQMQKLYLVRAMANPMANMVNNASHIK